MEYPDQEKYKLWPTTLNRTIFADIISAGSATGVQDKYPLIKLPRKRRPEPRSPLVEAYLYFYRQIQSWVTQVAATSGPYLASGDLEGMKDSIRARNDKLQTLGNLTLLNKYLNPAASNGSFQIKKTEYEQSVLRLNRYFDKKEKWDEDDINDRGKVLGEAICNIWPRPQ